MTGRINTGPEADRAERAAAFLRIRYKLTPREADVLRRRFLGERPKEIAHRLDIRLSTVRTYTNSYRTKTGVHDEPYLLLRTLVELDRTNGDDQSDKTAPARRHPEL